MEGYNIPGKLPEFVKYRKFLAGGEFVTLNSSKNFRSYSDREVQVFEKVDGGNCQVRKAGWQLLPGSKAKFLKGKIVHSWPWFEEFVKWTHSNDSLYNLPENVIVFGEWAGNHTIHYRPEYTNRFFVLDVFDIAKKRFMPYEEGCLFLEELGIKDVNLLNVQARGKPKIEMLEELLMKQPSDFYEGPKEGLVIKDYNSNPREFFRLYHPNFSERLRFAGTVNRLTAARFRKKVYEILESGETRIVKPREIISQVLADVQDENHQALRYSQAKRLFERYKNAGAFQDLERYFQERDEKKAEDLSYITPRQIRKCAEGYLREHDRISMGELINEIMRYSREKRKQNPDYFSIKDKIEFYLKNNKLGQVAQRIRS